MADSAIAAFGRLRLELVGPPREPSALPPASCGECPVILLQKCTQSQRSTTTCTSAWLNNDQHQSLLFSDPICLTNCVGVKGPSDRNPAASACCLAADDAAQHTPTDATCFHMLQVALKSLSSGNVPLTTSSAGILACMAQSEDTRAALLTAKPAVMPLLLGLFASTSPSLLASAAGEGWTCAGSQGLSHCVCGLQCVDCSGGWLSDRLLLAPTLLASAAGEAWTCASSQGLLHSSAGLVMAGGYQTGCCLLPFCWHLLR